MTMKPAFKSALKVTERFVTDNSPGILTGLGVAGAITASVLTGKAAYSAALAIHIEDERRVGDMEGCMNSKEKLLFVWKDYIPAAIALSAAVTSIIAANHIGSRRTAAIAAAFKLSEQLSEEYKEKVVRTLGFQKEEKVRSELAGERMARTPGSDLIIIAGSESIFFDELSGQYFKCEMETVRKAVNDINHQINNNYFASLSDFYDKIGLQKTSFSEEVGWNSDELLEVSYSATLLSDGRPAVSISYNKTPIHNYDRLQ